MASGATLLVFDPLANQPPGSNYATFATLNSQPIISFATAVLSYAIFPGVLPRNYSGGGITVNLYWDGDAVPASHSVVWRADWERDQSGTTDMSADDFDTADAQTATTACNNQYILNTTTLTFTNSQIDGLLIGERFRLRIQRVGTSGSDTFGGNAQLFAVEVKET